MFDEDYVDYMQYYKWTLKDVYVTRQKENAHYTSLEEFDIQNVIFFLQDKKKH